MYFQQKIGKRPRNEINYLFKLLNLYIKREINNLIKKNIKIKTIGNIKSFPTNLKLNIKKVETLTRHNDNIQINMALNYGSRQEIVEAVNRLKKSMIINEKNIQKNLYTRNIPDPEILIRTGNTNRISNFLIWQSIYTEIFFIKKM